MGFNSGFKVLIIKYLFVVLIRYSKFLARSNAVAVMLIDVSVQSHRRISREVPPSISLFFLKKVKVTLVQALRLCTGRTAHRGNRDIALLFHDDGTRRG